MGAAAGLVVILTACLSIYGLATYQSDRLEPKVGVKTLSGRSIEKDPLYSAKGWAEFTSGFAVGGLSGVLWCFILTQTLPFYYLTPDALGCVAAAGLVVIPTACLSIYGLATYQSDRLEPKVCVKTLSGRSIEKGPLYSAKGWAEFT